MNELSLHEYGERILELIERGRHTEAVAHGKHILSQYPRHVMTYRLLGQAMLEARQDEYAEDMFRRVISVDPEDLIAWVGMSEVLERRDELDAAIFYLERAYELATENRTIAEELRRFHGRRDGVEPPRIPLTRIALARLYLKGDQLSLSIREIQAVLTEDPDRFDLKVPLAEALWRNGQRLEASEICQQLLEVVPHCLKANLILGEILTGTGHQEGQAYLRRAEALDPDNRVASGLFGDSSPLPAREVCVAPLEYQPETVTDQPAWMEGLEVSEPEAALPPEPEAAVTELKAAVDAQIEIPSWLEKISTAEAVPNYADGPIELVGTGTAVDTHPNAAEEVVTVGLGLSEEELAVKAPPSIEELPDWLTELGVETPVAIAIAAPFDAPTEPSSEAPGPPSEIVPTADWVAELGVETAAPGEVDTPIDELLEPSIAAPSTPGEAVSTPDWLTALGAETDSTGEADEPIDGLLDPSIAAPSMPGEAVPTPDWLAGLEVETAPTGEAAEPIDAPLVPSIASPGTPGETVPTGDWLADLGIETVPTGEAASTFDVPLEPHVEDADGREEALPALDWLTELEAETISTGEGAAHPDMPLDAWLDAPSARGEAQPVPDWLSGEDTPSGEEALTWLEELAEGKDEEQRAQIADEPERRVAEAIGHSVPQEPTIKEVAPPALSLASDGPLSAAPSERFGWTGFGEPEPQAQTAAEEELAEPPVAEWLLHQDAALPGQAAATSEHMVSEIGVDPVPPLTAEAEGTTDGLEIAVVGETMVQPASASTELTVCPPAGQLSTSTDLGEPMPILEANRAAESAEGPPAAWVEGEAVPSGEDTLATLESLAHGKEERLGAKVASEAPPRMAEIVEPLPALEEHLATSEDVGTPIEEAIPLPLEEPPGLVRFDEQVGAPPDVPVEASAATALPPFLVEREVSKSRVEELEAEEKPSAVSAIQPTSLVEDEVAAEVVSRPVERQTVAPTVAQAPVRSPFDELQATDLRATDTTGEGEEIPPWLEPDATPSSDEAMAWLEQLAEGGDEVLSAMAAAEAERMANVMTRPATVGPVPEEIARDVHTVLADEAHRQAPSGEPRVARPAETLDEATPTGIVERETQSAGPPGVESVVPVMEAVVSDDEQSVDPEPQLVAEALPSAREIETPRALEEPTQETETPAPGPVGVEDMNERRAYVERHARDHHARLAFARALVEANEEAESLAAYAILVDRGKLLEDVIADLEQCSERRGTSEVLRVLGDAYMKDGKLEDALNIYRKALQTL